MGGVVLVVAAHVIHQHSPLRSDPVQRMTVNAPFRSAW